MLVVAVVGGVGEYCSKRTRFDRPRRGGWAAKDFLERKSMQHAVVVYGFPQAIQGATSSLPAM